MPRNAPAPDLLSVYHAFLWPSSSPGPAFCLICIILRNDTYEVWRLPISAFPDDGTVEYSTDQLVAIVSNSDESQLERTSPLSNPWAQDVPYLTETIRAWRLDLPTFNTEVSEPRRVMDQMRDLDAELTVPPYDPQPAPSAHTHQQIRMQVYLRVTNIHNHQDEHNVTTTTVTSVDDAGRQFIVDFTNLPVTALGCRPEEVQLLINSDGTIQVTFGPYHIRSNHPYDPVLRYFELVGSQSDANGRRHSRMQTPEQLETIRAAEKAKEEARKKERAIIKRIIETNPDMACVCCQNHIHEPENIVKLLGAEESERYLEFCKKNGQLPELYCCSCYELVEKEPKLIAQYTRMMQQYQYLVSERCKVADIEKTLQEEQQQVRQQKIQLVNDEIELRKTLELEKDANLRTVIRALGVNPKTLIKNIHTAKASVDLVHCNRCLISDVKTMMKCKGTKDPTQDCKSWTLRNE